jgi:Tfp pilus assembly protein PilN
VSFQTLEGLTVRTRVARVNLLPAGIDEARGARTARLLLAAGVVAVAAACGAAGIISGQHVTEAQDALAAEQAKTAPLRAAQQPYADVPVVQAQLAAAQKVQTTVNAYDVAWYSYLDQVAAKSPQDLSLTSLALSVSTAPTQAGATTTTDPLATGGIGTMTVTGQTKSQSQVATWMESMATIAGVEAPALSNSALDVATGVVTFNATATLTDDVLQSKQ